MMTKILTMPHEITDIPKAKKLKIKEASVVFDNVKFNYNETRTILSDFNLNVKSHEKLALVGPSGAGKSTIVKLLLRQHDVTDGHILIDGQDIAKVTQESLWDAVSLVPQEPLLFHRTLMENIRYGKPDASDDEVVEAAKLAYCHEFISSFPEGYGTFVGERGVKLSGGERQRVAIARAILRNAPILVLDEATSSLDSESEGLIQAALTNLMKGKTVIVIAHRLSTIMKMDRIIVVSGGKISEEGSHDELLKHEHGLYKKLWDLQAGGFVGE
jgi:ABC-type multidrug transport system fused ATPase/permease subunit